MKSHQKSLTVRFGPAVEVGVGLFQITAGLAALPFLMQLARRLADLKWTATGVLSMTLATTVCAIYVASIVAGILLVGQRRSGRLLSVVVQAFLVPAFSVGGAVYKVVVGCAIHLRVWPPVTLRAQLGSEASIWLSGREASLSLSLNLVSIAIILILLRDKFGPDAFGPKFDPTPRC